MTLRRGVRRTLVPTALDYHQPNIFQVLSFFSRRPSKGRELFRLFSKYKVQSRIQLERRVRRSALDALASCKLCSSVCAAFGSEGDAIQLERFPEYDEFAEVPLIVMQVVFFGARRIGRNWRESSSKGSQNPARTTRSPEVPLIVIQVVFFPRKVPRTRSDDEFAEQNTSCAPVDQPEPHSHVRGQRAKAEYKGPPERELLHAFQWGMCRRNGEEGVSDGIAVWRLNANHDELADSSPGGGRAVQIPRRPILDSGAWESMLVK
ncbi:hypothetical protein FB451DRAFT_1364367 [Mycena latifolia]|nr:hypothetical protein FB451DRAFT_1364367 [Mycena latifolia]